MKLEEPNWKPKEFIEGVRNKVHTTINNIPYTVTGRIDEVIEKLQKIKQDNPQLVEIEMWVSDSGKPEIIFYGYRLENDQEYIARQLDTHEKMKVWELKEEKNRQIREENERERYLELKKKYEGNKE